MKVSGIEFEKRKRILDDRFEELKRITKVKFGENAIPKHCWLDFNLKGRCAGIAYSSGKIRLNKDMIANGSFDHILKETFPHELAHIICFCLGTDRGHGKSWKRFAMFLGCSGNRCHAEPVAYVRGITYIYIATCGKEVRVSQTLHKRIQLGRTYIVASGGRITQGCSYTTLKKSA